MSDPFPSSAKAVAYLGQRRVQYMDWPVDDRPLAGHEVAGRTLVSLISPGTETSCSGFHLAAERPRVGGYAAVFEIAAVGAAVRGWAVGQRALCFGPHASWQRRAESDLVAVPEDLPVDQAPFARLMGVGWSTLTTTTARPPDRVLVLGLGLVGNLAAQLFQAAGYVVTAVDPNASRRQLAERCGIGDVRPSAAGQGDLVGAPLPEPAPRPRLFGQP
jgi:NADPH:quinone reductase-like Zn-dependent oxidoreductase